MEKSLDLLHDTDDATLLTVLNLLWSATGNTLFPCPLCGDPVQVNAYGPPGNRLGSPEEGMDLFGPCLESPDEQHRIMFESEFIQTYFRNLFIERYALQQAIEDELAMRDMEIRHG